MLGAMGDMEKGNLGQIFEKMAETLMEEKGFMAKFASAIFGKLGVPKKPEYTTTKVTKKNRKNHTTITVEEFKRTN